MSINSQDPVDFENFLQALQKKGLGQDKCIQEYRKSTLVNNYNEISERLEYIGPRYCADMLAGLVSDRETARVLDIAAGTGLVGQQLHQRGFYNVDAHDGSAAMLESCKKLGVYINFINCFVGEGHSLPIAENSYNAITCSGATTENHLPASAQAEFVRAIKPGGFFVNAFRTSTLATEYGKRWETEARKMEDGGKWIFYGRLHFPKYNMYSDGVVDIYQVL